MKDKINYIIFLCVLRLSSCVFIHIDDSIDLGNRYYYLPDNDNSTILLNIAKDSDSKFGVDIISEGVKEYNYDSLFIIAKTYNNRDGVISFWLIDKREPKRVDHCIEKQCIDSILTSLIIKKFDSTDFYNYLLQNNIELRF